MSWFPEIADPQPSDGVTRSILWPFVFWPLIWILLVHVGTRVAWLLGFG